MPKALRGNLEQRWETQMLVLGVLGKSFPSPGLSLLICKIGMLDKISLLRTAWWSPGFTEGPLLPQVGPELAILYAGLLPKTEYWVCSQKLGDHSTRVILTGLAFKF